MKGFAASGIAKNFDLVIVGRNAWGGSVEGVHAIENQSDDQLSVWYRDSFAVVLPSLYEGFGLPLVEAMSYGKPLVLSDIPVFREISNDLAHFFDPNDIDSIANALQEVSEINFDENERRERILRANSFTWEKTAQKYHDLYLKIVK